jgi:hypothetical protein
MALVGIAMAVLAIRSGAEPAELAVALTPGGAFGPHRKHTRHSWLRAAMKRMAAAGAVGLLSAGLVFGGATTSNASGGERGIGLSAAQAPPARTGADGSGARERLAATAYALSDRANRLYTRWYYSGSGELMDRARDLAGRAREFSSDSEIAARAERIRKLIADGPSAGLEYTPWGLSSVAGSVGDDAHDNQVDVDELRRRLTVIKHDVNTFEGNLDRLDRQMPSLSVELDQLTEQQNDLESARRVRNWLIGAGSAVVLVLVGWWSIHRAAVTRRVVNRRHQLWTAVESGLAQAGYELEAGGLEAARIERASPRAVRGTPAGRPAHTCSAQADPFGTRRGGPGCRTGRGVLGTGLGRCGGCPGGHRAERRAVERRAGRSAGRGAVRGSGSRSDHRGRLGIPHPARLGR